LTRGQTQSIHVTMHVTARNGAAHLLNSEAEQLSGPRTEVPRQTRGEADEEVIEQPRRQVGGGLVL